MPHIALLTIGLLRAPWGDPLVRGWFTKVDAPSHVAWWIDEGHLPTWAEAAERHAELAEDGPSARAFDFRSPFDAAGRATAIDREAVRRHAPGPTT